MRHIQMVKHSLVALLLASFSNWYPPAYACACQNKIDPDMFSQQEAEAARRLPSEADRNIARDFTKNGMFVDAAVWYLKASDRAATEISQSQEKLQEESPHVTAPAMRQRALHSADIHREASLFFQQHGKVGEAATTRERTLAAEIAANNQSDLSREYGIIARLYESAGQPNKAAEMYKKQGDIFAASKGRYSAEATFAQAEFRRLQQRLSYTLHH